MSGGPGVEPTVRVERKVGAPPEAVWALVSDITRMGEWSPESTGGRWIGSATGPRVGARFLGNNRRGRRWWATLCRVVVSEPGRAFAFKATAGPVRIATWRYDLEPTDGGCVVAESWFDERGRLAKALGRPVSGVAERSAHNRAGMEETLRRLAAVAEAGAAT